jgi:hypothetical protein
MAVLAGRQHGVVSRAQLHALGLSDSAIHSRVASARLHRVFRGVYAVGHGDIRRSGLMFAAVLACGEGAVVSHGSAAELLGLWDKEGTLVEVIAGGGAGRKVRGIRWHRGGPLPGDEVTVRDGVPCTTASRTLVDLSGQIGERSIRRLVQQAAVLRLLDVPAIDRTLARRRRRGAPALRSAISPWRTEERPQTLRSGLEARLFAAISRTGMPLPRCNVRLTIAGHRLEVDLIWEEQRLVVETDGERVHHTAVAFRRDRWRDQLLASAGYRTARVTWQQLEEEQGATLDRIRRMLELPRASCLPVRLISP